MTELGIDEGLLLDIAKIFIAIICGAIVGFERELKDKPAGLRTNILVSTGSCVFVILSLHTAQIYSDDAGRIIGPIITGIGFLGAGTIIRARGSVRGLTSAATIWVVAGIGMMVGLSEFLFAIVISFIVLFILLILPKAEKMISDMGVTDLEYVIITKPTKSAIQRTEYILKTLPVNYYRFNVSKEEDTYIIRFFAHGRPSELFRLIPALVDLPEVLETKMENPKYSY